MSAKSFFLALPIAFISVLSATASAVIIEGKFTGTIAWTTDCEILPPGTPGTCSLLWENDPAGSIASGSFWYDTDLAPPDTSPMETYGLYFTYTNAWVNMSMDIGGKHFDFSDSSTVNDEMWDVEHISVVDNYKPEPDGSELQSLTISDKTSSGHFDGDFITKGMTLYLTTWEQPILSGTSLIQEYAWQENGNLLQGFVSFHYQSLLGDDLKYADAWINLTDFTMNIRSVPEPSSFVLFALMVVGMCLRRFLQLAQ